MLSSKHIIRSPNNFHFEAVKTTCLSLNSFSKNLTFPKKVLFETNDLIKLDLKKIFFQIDETYLNI